MGWDALSGLVLEKPQKKKGAVFLKGDGHFYMVTKRTELKIRGLTQKEIDYLKAQSKRTKSKSFNDFLVRVLHEKIEKDQFNFVEANYLAHLENMKLTSNHVLQLTKKQTEILSDFETKMGRYADHISRWLEYEGEVEDD